MRKGTNFRAFYVFFGSVREGTGGSGRHWEVKESVEKNGTHLISK
ncbi:hypothetical protein HMPREF3213_01335 [Heyndrickxia coagulans]|uniref:Uncharacterized protein n=1 Tax=Heyndrickxia coagulans TaxID=1398 RepID=A0A0C5CU04_HEYCO|nr:hypothetical protein SB48_HM08orf06504 [Heyndrickxia coagulans]KWZ83262.1 hypothetical protein HMPREF3213_01335 [Heyndrickxia coagulans]KYC65009.1 hypothetical protein B4100_1225 [Heyndrickxia coagulans]